MERRLAAILAADVVGYSRLMGEDEKGTLEALKDHRAALVEPKIAAYHGRLVKLMGDGALAEFGSVVDAVQCAVDIQRAMAARNASVPEDRRIVFRIGINIGDVIIEEDDIYGDGVNVAARLEGLAEPGGICVSRNVRNQVRDKVDLVFEDRGEVEIKNIARPVRVFSVRLDETSAAPSAPDRASPRPKGRPNWAFAAVGAAVLILVAAGFLWWQPWAPRPALETVVGEVRPPTDRPSIAVLPFDNLSDDPEQEYFADGMTDDLITDLSKISGLFVIARNAVFTYKDQQGVDIRDVARDLGVRYVLEGSVRRAGAKMRINAQLIDGETGNHLWAERYDRSYADIFDIQDQVIENIVAALSVRLSEAERTQFTSLPTENLEAYDYYLRGEKLAYLAEPTAAAGAMRYYQKATGLDPEFAGAYAGYARVAVDVLRYTYADNLPSAVARKSAYEAASRALTLDPGLARAFSVFALLQMLDGEHENAVASAEKAVTLSPNDAEALLNQAVVLVYAGMQEEALQAMEKVFRLNPKPPDYVQDYYALVLAMNHRYDEALAALERKRGDRDSDLSLELSASLNARQGRPEEAAAVIERMLQRWPGQSLAYYRVYFAHHARAQDRDERLEGLRLAGLPAWPHGFEGVPEQRLAGAAIDAITRGKTWTGMREGRGAFVQFMQANGAFVERGADYQLVGDAFREGDLLCLQTPTVLMGRVHCGPIFRNPSGSAAQQDDYVYPNAYQLKRFSVSK